VGVSTVVLPGAALPDRRWRDRVTDGSYGVSGQAFPSGVSYACRYHTCLPNARPAHLTYLLSVNIFYVRQVTKDVGITMVTSMDMTIDLEG
jgi:hypothetical protein